MSIPEAGTRSRLLAFIQKYLRKVDLLDFAYVSNLTVADLTVPARSADPGAISPVDFEQVGGLIIGETIIPEEESSSTTFSWTLTATPSNAQDWHPSSNNDFYGLAGVTFVVPASGRVEIQVRCSLDSTTGAERIYLRLCTATNGTSLGTRYQKVVLRTRPNNTSEYTLLQTWTLVGLTPGTSTTYYLGAAAEDGTHYIKAGGACTGDADVTTDAWPQFTMRAIAVASNATTV